MILSTARRTRMRLGCRTASRRHTAVGVMVLLALPVLPTNAQPQTPSADSVAILNDIRELQAEFESYRQSRTPVQTASRPDGVCDERIGRICIWFGGAEEERFPAELREVGQARVALVRELSAAFEEIRDSWVIGQRVHYLVEGRNMDEAQRVATECGIVETWWCDALRGYVLHVWTRYVESESAFRDALAAMPDEEREQWTTPRYIFTRGAEEDFNDASPSERERRWELLWRLSDPLFLFEGNDRLTDHLARWVVAKNRRDAADPLGLAWEADLEETLIRYGRNIGYSRTHDPSRMMGGGFQDTRRMVGHHHPKSRGYLFPEEFLSSPSDIPAETWITAPREARTWYAPPYAPDIRGLDTQVGRFRRDERMLVVGAYRPTLPVSEENGGTVAAWRADGGIEGPPLAALFLVTEEGDEPVYVRGDDAEGVLTMEAVPGRYVSGLEVVDLQGRQAWRARQGVVQRPLTPGMVDVSDLMILKEGAPLPESLDEALPHLRTDVRMRAGERFPVLWEAYGLQVLEPVRVTIGFSRGRPGFLARVGEFLGVIEPPQSVDITFDDIGPDRLQLVFRSVVLELPDLDPGEYTLHLQLELTGRTPLVTSRPIIVER